MPCRNCLRTERSLFFYWIAYILYIMCIVES